MLGKVLIAWVGKLLQGLKESEYQDYSQRNFEPSHLVNCKSLVDRISLLHEMKPNSVAAEIGVFKGDFSKAILEITEPDKLFLVDAWDTDRYNSGHFKLVTELFASEIAASKVEIMKGLSTSVIPTFPEGSLDWVYLDTNHSLETTRRELELLRPKMKGEGVIAGHDYIQGNWNSGRRYGVIEAVRDFCLDHDWELFLITHELDNHPSFAIRKIAT